LLLVGHLQHTTSQVASAHLPLASQEKKWWMDENFSLFCSYSFLFFFFLNF
jgi:hypothetical protein